MAITQQFTAGQILTASALNQSSIPVVGSNSDITSPFTGQIIFNTSDSKLYRYTGSSWAIFVGGHTWAIRRAAAQSMNSTTFTAVLFDTDDNDTGNFHSTSVNLDQVVIGQAGLYALSAKGSWATASPTSGTRYVDITLNGTTIPGSSSRLPALANPDATAIATPTIYQSLVVNDVLRVREWHNQGAALNTATSSADQPLFTGAWLHD